MSKGNVGPRKEESGGESDTEKSESGERAEAEAKLHVNCEAHDVKHVRMLSM